MKRDFKDLTATQILSINRPEKLFSGPDSLQEEYRALARLWHPDHNVGVDQAVIAKISELYELGQKKAKEDAWEVIGVTTIETKDKKKYKIRYHVHRKFELGEMYICDSVLVFLIEKSFKDLVENSNRIVRDLRFENDKMKNYFVEKIPRLNISSETDTHIFQVYHKTADVFSVRDLLNYFNGKIPPKHATWMLSRLHNFACYLKYSNLSHNDLNLDTFFVSPHHHTGMVIGGWWYATKLNSKMIALPNHTLKYIPEDILNSKMGSMRTDSILIKVLARTLFGDETGCKLISDPDIPKSIFNWIQSSSGTDPVEDYKDWTTKIITNAFGKREFVKLELSPEDIYTH